MSEGVSDVRVFDLHCDTIDRLGMLDDPDYAGEAPEGAARGQGLGSNDAALAADRMLDGQGRRVGWCQCYAVWVPDRCGLERAQGFYRRGRDWFLQHARKGEGVEALRDAGQARSVVERGGAAGMLTVENGLAIGEDLANVEAMARDGVKMITLTWNAANQIGSGKWTPGGLTPFGEQVVREMERNRIVVDVSHLNDAGFADLLKVARRPFAASHSNSRAVCDVPRNLTDDEFRTIRDMGGVVGINYYRGFVAKRYEDVPDGQLAPDGDVTFDELAAHIEHFLDLGGEDVLALGSDYDGSAVPGWLDGCEKVAAFHGLVCERFGREVADKMFFENACAFFERNERA